MRIKLNDIPRGGLAFDETRPVEWLTNFPDLIEDCGVSAAGPVTFRLVVNRIGGQVQINGDIRLPVRVECARCIEEVLTEIKAPVNVVLVPAEPGNESEDAEDEGYGTYSGEEIDIAEHLRGQLALHFPWRLLCRDDCKGLCPQCGADLNKEPCNCSKERIDPRWEALNKLKL